jgi:hypothetical protein
MSQTSLKAWKKRKGSKRKRELNEECGENKGCGPGAALVVRGDYPSVVGNGNRNRAVSKYISYYYTHPNQLTPCYHQSTAEPKTSRDLRLSYR